MLRSEEDQRSEIIPFIVKISKNYEERNDIACENKYFVGFFFVVCIFFYDPCHQQPEAVHDCFILKAVKGNIVQEVPANFTQAGLGRLKSG